MWERTFKNAKQDSDLRHAGVGLTLSDDKVLGEAQDLRRIHGGGDILNQGEPATASPLDLQVVKAKTIRPLWVAGIGGARVLREHFPEKLLKIRPAFLELLELSDRRSAELDGQHHWRTVDKAAAGGGFAFDERKIRFDVENWGAIQKVDAAQGQQYSLMRIDCQQLDQRQAKGIRSKGTTTGEYPDASISSEARWADRRAPTAGSLVENETEPEVRKRL